MGHHARLCVLGIAFALIGNAGQIAAQQSTTLPKVAVGCSSTNLAAIGRFFGLGSAQQSDSPSQTHAPELIRYLQGAELGDAYAMVRYADACTENEPEAMRWLRKAADLGNPEAMRLVGLRYQFFKSMKDVNEAFRWYSKAAENGDAIAMDAVGDFYERGEGAPKDRSKARQWYMKAAICDVDAARRSLNKLGVTRLDGPTVVQLMAKAQSSYGRNDFAGAAHFYRNAADCGNSVALWMLGAMSSGGYGVGRNDAEAIRWWRKAANVGHVFAMTSIGTLYEVGRGVPKDLVEARRWYTMASLRGNEAARHALQTMDQQKEIADANAKQAEVEARKSERYCLQLYGVNSMEAAQCHEYLQCGQYPIGSFENGRCNSAITQNIFVIRQAGAEIRRGQEIRNAIDAANARAAEEVRRASEEGWIRGYDEGAAQNNR